MSGKRLSQRALRELGIAEDQLLVKVLSGGKSDWPPEAVRFRQWDFGRAVWFFRTAVTHAPRPGNSVLTYCGLDWLGSHTVNVEGPSTCKRCARAYRDDSDD